MPGLFAPSSSFHALSRTERQTRQSHNSSPNVDEFLGFRHLSSVGVIAIISVYCNVKCIPSIRSFI